MIVALRPFRNFSELVQRLGETRGLSDEMAVSGVEQLKVEASLEKILHDCRKETEELAQAVEYLKREAHTGSPIAPDLLTNPELTLNPYQVRSTPHSNFSHWSLHDVLKTENGEDQCGF